MENRRSTTLQPTIYAWYGYLIPGILLTPLFGLGLILIWMAYREMASTLYDVYDHEIKISLPAESITLQIAEINDVDVRMNRLDGWLGVGTIVLTTTDGNRLLRGLKNPEELAQLIRHAASVEKKRLERQNKIEARTPDQHPGTLERLNDLAGLWQQGLITEEEYHREKRHFEES